MGNLRFYLVLIAFSLAAGLAIVAATMSAEMIEDSSEINVRNVLDRNGLTWAEVEADGLRVILSGTAPTEALRFRALSLVGSVLDAERVANEMEVAASEAIAPPRFSAEVLRNTAGLSLIGLIPASSDRDAIVDGFVAMGDAQVTDLLEVADYPAPSGWEDALAYAVAAIEGLPRAKVSVDAGRVEITAIANSEEDKTAMEARLTRMAPPALQLSLNISAPRPVITPYTLRFVMDENGARFDACSADTLAAQTVIINAAFTAGLTGPGRCTIGMGVPSKNWAEAVELAIGALAEIGSGTVTFSNADVTLAAGEGTPEALFDRVVGELETSLPEVFVLQAVLPSLPEESVGPVEFNATLSPEGQVQLRGRLPSEDMREVTDSYARAKFGSDAVYTAARVVENMPLDWLTRVLTGIDALAFLNNGLVSVQSESMSVSGVSGDPDAQQKIARLMVEKLGEDGVFDIDVSYQEALDPIAALPTPEECEARIAAIISDEKIVFEPGSATIDETAVLTMDLIAEALQDCGNLRLEVQGHTDSQGREEMNLSLSQARAESILNELRARKVLTRSFTAKGYGEAQPIADNDTEAGREANRRIEFKLIRPEPSVPEGESALESLAESSDIEQADSDNSDAAGAQGDDQ